MNDHHDPETEDRIRRALAERADGTVTSPDSLDAIQRRRVGRSWARPATYAAVAAAIVLIAGVALANLPDDDGPAVDSAVSTTLPTTLPSYPTVAPPDPYPTTGPATTSIPVDRPASQPRTFYGPVTFEDRGGDAWHAAPLASSRRLVREGLAYWPTDDRVFSDWDSVSLAYLEDVHGITDPVQITSVGYSLDPAEPVAEAAGVGSWPTAFQRTTESGEPFGMGMLIGAAADANGDWHIGQVVSDRLWIDAVEASAASQGLLRIRGGGEAFEGTAILTIDDAEPIVVAVGAFQPESFSVLVPYDGRDQVRVTLQANDPIDGALPYVVGGVATVQAVDGPLDNQPITYSVFGVADDDRLNVRSGAGVTNDIITTLAPDATRIRLTGAEEMVGDSRWVEVDLDGRTGWIHSRFIVANPDTARTPELDEAIDSLLRRIPELEAPIFAEVVEIGGIGAFADWPTPWTPVAPGDFDLLRDWNPDGTQDRCAECVKTVEGFLGFDTAKWQLAQYSTQEPWAPAAFQGGAEDHFFATGLFPEFGDRFVTGAIFIPEPNPEVSLDWRHYTVVFDFDNGEPVVRGIWRWGWTP